MLEEKRFKEEEARKKSILAFFTKTSKQQPNQTPSSSPHSKPGSFDKDKQSAGFQSGEAVLINPAKHDDEEKEEVDEKESYEVS